MGFPGSAAGQSDFGGARGRSGKRRQGGRGAVPVAAPLVCGQAPRAMATAPPPPPRAAQPRSPGRSAHFSSHRWRRALEGTHARARTLAHSGRPRAPGGELEAPGVLGLPCPRRLWARPQVLQS